MNGAAVKTRGRQAGGSAGGGGQAVRRAATPQAGAVPAYARAGLKVGARHSPQEREAEAVGRAVKSGAPAPAIGGLAPAVQRAATPDEKIRKATKEAQEEQSRPVARAAQPSIEKLPPPVQKAAKPEEKAPVRKAETTPVKQEMPVQKASRPEETKPVQRAPEEDHATDTPEPEVDRAPAAGGGGATPQAEAAQAMATARQGEARPLSPQVRGVLEGSLGADLSAVRLHDGPAAMRAADLLQARAMTQGSDIFLGKGESEGDLELMGHEVAHVLQQGSGGEPQVQRAPAAGAAAAPASSGGGKKDKPPRQPKDPKPNDIKGDPGTYENAALGKIRMKNPTEVETVEMAKVEVPKFKQGFHPAGLKLSAKNRKGLEKEFAAKTKDEEKGTQVEIWERMTAKGVPKMAAAVREQGDKAGQAFRKNPEDQSQSDTTNPRVFFFGIKAQKTSFHISGTAEEIAQRAARPIWNKSGELSVMQVDHKQELQLGGENHINNLWLLNQSANGYSGIKIQEYIEEYLHQLRESAEAALSPDGYVVPSWGKLRYNEAAPITVRTIVGKGAPKAGFHTWDSTDIEEGKPVEQLKPLDPKAVEALGGGKNQLSLFTNRQGGMQVSLPYDAAAGQVTDLSSLKVLGFNAQSLTYKQGAPGTLVGSIQPKDPAVTPAEVTMAVQPMPGLTNAAVIDIARIPYVQTHVTGASPFELQTFEFRGNSLYASGEIKPTLSLLKNTRLFAELDGGELRLAAEIDAGALSIPGPVKITDSTLTIVGGTDGIGARGAIGLEIERVGRGRIAASAGTVGVSLSGSFDFDSKLFTQASIDASYEDGAFSADGTLSIGEGKVKGIKAATIKAHYDKETLSAEGEVQPSIPGVKEGKLAVTHEAAKGLTIAGDLTLGTIPGFSGGKLSATVAQKDEGWAVKADGSLTPAIPGITGQVEPHYDNGGFLARGTLGFEKGMLKGSATLGASNQAVGADGVPAGPPTETLTMFGSGSATLRLAPWLQATAGLTFKPNGEVAVDGQIGLPSAIDLFPAKRLDKELFSIGMDIPILGFAVAGQRVGIFANISGGAQVGAGIGPGQLTAMALAVHYNPAHEEETEVTGTAKLSVPADAGLRVFVRAGIGAGVPIVSAQGGLEAGGQLGLSGALDAGVDVNWKPGKGLSIAAAAELYAEPKLRFDLKGFAKVEADLFVTTVELYQKTWELAAIEIGSGMKLGVKFPVKYEEGKPFNLSLSDVEFTVPQIDPAATIGKVIGQVV